jgi:beta-glucosidase
MVPVGAAQTTRALPYRNSQLPIAERVSDLLARLTLEEKFWQLFMVPGDLDDPGRDYSQGIFGLQISPAPAGGTRDARTHAERINAIQRYFAERTRHGIPIIPFDEALHGLAREGATMFPQAIGLAATWDTALMGRVADAAARETRSRGIRQVLSPVVNLASDVRWGRVEETYGEDPHLASMMARAFVSRFEAAGIITTPKHFVANVGEGGRDSYPIAWGIRHLEEYFFPPFQAALAAGARSVMTAYNSVDGTPATQNRWLLGETLKRDWRFGGFVVSDAAATGGATVLHLTEADTRSAAGHALRAGLDVIFQSSYEQYLPYWEAFRRGEIAGPFIDSAVSRVLKAKFQLGLFESPLVDPDTAAYWNGHASHRRLAGEAARAGMVLLRNERNRLPFARSIRSVAVIGTDAVEARLGGYSGPGIRKVSIFEAIRDRLGADRVRYAPGPGRLAPDFLTVPAEFLSVDGTTGVRAEYFANPRLEGAPALVRVDRGIDFAWTITAPGPRVPLDWYSVRWTGTITGPAKGARRIGLEGNDGYRLWLDDRLVIDGWSKQSHRARLAEVSLQPGKSYRLRVEFFETFGNGRIRLVWDHGSPDWRAEVDGAVRLARTSEVTVVVAGIEEGEFRDRARLSLPGKQEELIRAVAATGTPVVVVLVGGSAVTMSSWLELIDAVLFAWYPGEEGGNAVADVLFGEHNPSGRLPITFPISEGQLPLVYNHKPTGRGDDYVDLTGQPLFPFGFGLSYTTFEYSDLRIEPLVSNGPGTVTVSCRIRNTGSRPGHEVVQLYLKDLLASVARPVMELKGFERIYLLPGRDTVVTFRLGREALEMLDASMNRVVEPGNFRVMVGASSKDIRLRGEFTVR